MLDNGATIVCRYVPESPLVTVQIRVLSGLSNEGEYAGSGISHFLEHLLFKGTRNMTSNDIRKKIKAMGGSINGSTGLDSAEYHITVPNEYFEKALPLLTDMVMAPAFTDGEMETERDVILKEIKLRNDDPVRRRIRLLFSQAYREHVYKFPGIGYEERLKKLSRDDILRYHRSVYTPDRIVMGIAGGVPPERALKAAKNKLKRYRKGKPWMRSVPLEPGQLDERKSVFPADVTLGYIAIGFHTTSLYSPDLYAGDVLSILLGEGRDSRLYKRLVRDKQLLYAVSSLNYTPKYPGLFVVLGIGDPDKIDQARQEILAVIDEVKTDEILDVEMERAKNIVISNYLHSHERIDDITSSMTNSQILTGDPAFFEKYVDETKKVEEEDIGQIASRYLDPGNSTTVILLPRDLWEERSIKPGEPVTEAGAERVDAAGPERDDVRHGPLKRGDMELSGGKVEPRAQKSGAPSIEGSRGKVPLTGTGAGVKESERFVTLDNGMRLIVKRRERVPLVSVTLAALGGLRAENRSDNGISNLVSSVILKGTGKRGEAEIVPVIERMGGGISVFSGLNSVGITMDLLAEDLDKGLDVFEDVARNAVFPEKEIILQKKKIIASIKEEQTNIFENGLIRLRGTLYGDHPYAMRVSGEPGSVNSISRNEMLNFYKKHFVPGNTVVAVVGDVDVEKVTKNMKKRFNTWKGAGEPLSKKQVVPLEQIRRKDITMRKAQSLLLFGFQGVDVKDERKYALSVISSLLSGSDGLLFSALREKYGLVYASGAVSVPGLDPGYFILYAATTEENIEKAKGKILEMLKKIIAGDIADEDIESSKKWLISQDALSMETNLSFSMVTALDELYGIGFQDYKTYPEKIRSVNKDDIKRCAKEIFNLDKYALVVVHSER